jgi:hypothetical protein
MSSGAKLRRFWFKFEDHWASPRGYGVTAWTRDDAVEILRSQIFEGGEIPRASVTEDVDVSELDAGQVLPNMEAPNWRGIWFPRGFARNSN